MNSFKHAARLLSLLLALAVVLAPVTPAFASVAKAGDAHAVHAAHDGGHRADAPAADGHSAPCPQHDDSCAGQCGACCGHCAGAVSFFQPASPGSLPVQTPISSQLHSLVLITSLDRPPRLLPL